MDRHPRWRPGHIHLAGNPGSRPHQHTYRHTGLPPTPIACPGRSALQAALHPPPGPWLYYVLADASGKHAFATTIAEFNRLKAEAQRKGLLSG